MITSSVKSDIQPLSNMIVLLRDVTECKMLVCYDVLCTIARHADTKEIVSLSRCDKELYRRLTHHRISHELSHKYYPWADVSIIPIIRCHGTHYKMLLKRQVTWRGTKGWMWEVDTKDIPDYRHRMCTIVRWGRDLPIMSRDYCWCSCIEIIEKENIFLHRGVYHRPNNKQRIIIDKLRPILSDEQFDDIFSHLEIMDTIHYGGV